MLVETGDVFGVDYMRLVQKRVLGVIGRRARDDGDVFRNRRGGKEKGPYERTGFAGAAATGSFDLDGAVQPDVRIQIVLVAKGNR